MVKIPALRKMNSEIPRSFLLCNMSIQTGEGRGEGERTYSQMEMINRRVGLSLFQMEEGMVTNSFLG